VLGAVAMVTIGRLPLKDAYAAIDLDVMVFLLGVLLITGFLEIGGFFEWAAGHVVRRARSPRALLAAVVATSGLLSAFFVNDTICLVLTPLVIAALRPLGLGPLPFLLAIALGSNVGSAMTPMGNPQNMLIGVASGIPFAKFIASLALPSLGGLVIVFGVLSFVHRAELSKSFPADADMPRAHFDGPLVKRSLLVFAGAAHHRAARAWLERLGEQSISYTDAVSFAVMDAARCGGVMSFDHDFLLAGFSLWFG
jgi:Na+/H+ antiporter NhaD/arsenite permease-like protein